MTFEASSQESLTHIMVAILALLGLEVAIMISIIVSRVTRSVWNHWRAHHLVNDRAAILRVIAGTPPYGLEHVHRRAVTRNMIAALAERAAGEELSRLSMAYTALGFAERDFKILHGRSRKARARALARCRDLLLPLPADGWRYLIEDRDPVVRWAAREYVVATKGLQALPWVLGSLNSMQPEELGVTLHILCCLAQRAPDAVLTVMRCTDNPLLVELCLRTLAAYPLPQSHGLILRHLRVDASDETFIAAMKALGTYPSPEALQTYRSCVKHHHWVVRLEAAKALQMYPQPEAIAVADALAGDPNYFVRREAVRSLILLRSLSQQIIDKIRTASHHPAASILTGLEADGEATDVMVA